MELGTVTPSSTDTDKYNAIIEERKTDIMPRLDRLKEILDGNGVEYICDELAVSVEINSVSKQRLGQALIDNPRILNGIYYGTAKKRQKDKKPKPAIP